MFVQCNLRLLHTIARLKLLGSASGKEATKKRFKIA
jgi:hypothetical protein